jgi:hypothetical protein
VEQSVGVRVPPFAWRQAFFLNGDQNEEKKRDPRLLEETERTAASFGARSNETSAAGTASGAAGESWKAARHVDEIGTARLVIATTIGLPHSSKFG